MKSVTSWGRTHSALHQLESLDHRQPPESVILNSSLPGLAFGKGRSYGDACLNPNGTLWLTSGLDHLLNFDPDSGRLVCEAGVLLRDIQRLMIPRGWMLPVTPGTQMVTVGGAIANDVHGKNHHVVGSFGDHILSLTLQRTDGEVIHCTSHQQREWLHATIGGLGLTGVILKAEIQLKCTPGPWLHTETLPYHSLNEFLELADESETQWEHTVSWIDCLSGGNRGIFMRANPSHSESGPRPPSRTLTMPLVPPISLVNGLTLKPFNFAYYQAQTRKRGPGISHYEPFFYPLDNLQHWNRMYGPKGFYQYQCVVPRAEAHAAIDEMLAAIKQSGLGSFLAVLKTFGNRQPLGLLSFPQPGVTLALDFPNAGHRTQRLFQRLDDIVRTALGRLYPAKDARMPRDLFEAGYPQLNTFLTYRDPGISSALSRRLMGS